MDPKQNKKNNVFVAKAATQGRPSISKATIPISPFWGAYDEEHVANAALVEFPWKRPKSTPPWNRSKSSRYRSPRMDLPMAGCLFIIGKMLGVTPWDGSPFIIKPIYTPYIVGICWVYPICLMRSNEKTEPKINIWLQGPRHSYTSDLGAKSRDPLFRCDLSGRKIW